jgi:hypothetical protein
LDPSTSAKETIGYIVLDLRTAQETKQVLPFGCFGKDYVIQLMTFNRYQINEKNTLYVLDLMQSLGLSEWHSCYILGYELHSTNSRIS